MRYAAYVYPGWHPIPERNEAFHDGFTEWELVRACRPGFPGHHQPRVPLLGTYDDRDPSEVERRVRMARSHGVDAFIWGMFWCRGKRVFEEALDAGFLGSPYGRKTPFAVMWANRMPRRVLPVRNPDQPTIEAGRLVPTDVADFARLIRTVAQEYFSRPNYLTVSGLPYFSVFDSTFFIQELGTGWAREAIAGARRWLRENGFPGMHLGAIEPNKDVLPLVREVGFDSVTHYVNLPEWKGPPRQDYRRAAASRATEWPQWHKVSGLPYMPSVSPGWDASPRGADFGARRPDRYPWSPVVTGEHPELFHDALCRAAAHPSPIDDPLVMVASLNEWSEGHYLEPDKRFGMGWLEAVRDSRA